MSAPDEQILCGVCRKRPANHHIAEVISGTMSIRDFCTECLEASGMDANPAEKEIKPGSVCRYCGSQPGPTGTDFLALALGEVRQSEPICMNCSLEYLFFAQRELSRISHLSGEEQQARLQSLRGEADEHMREWVVRKK